MMVRGGLLTALLVGAIIVMPGDDIEYSQPIPIVPVTLPTSTSSTTTTVVPTSAVPVSTTAEVIRVTTTTTTLVPDTARCPEWWTIAVGAGWPADPAMLATLDWIMWRESRCLPDVIGDGSYGLTQLQWSVHGDWIVELGFTRDDLLEPAANLALAKVLFDRVDDDPNFWCGFSPWYMSEPGTHWCRVWKEFQ
jgi:hypothetical protein